MMRMRSRVGWTVTAPEYGRTCVPGEIVDMAERLPRGGTLGDLVSLEWFEAVEPPAKPRVARGAAKTDTTVSEPGEPAKE